MSKRKDKNTEKSNENPSNVRGEEEDAGEAPLALNSASLSLKY